MNLLATILMTLIVLVPHGDDEVTVMPQILAAEDVRVVVVTDGAGTSKCARKFSEACEQRRYESTKGFLEEVAPHATLEWIGVRDGYLTERRAELIAANIGDGTEHLLVAGTDYGHGDHTALREGGRRMGAELYDGTRYWVPRIFRAVKRWYGWLVTPRQIREHLGLSR